MTSDVNMFLYLCFRLPWEASLCDFYVVPRYGECLRNEDQYVCGCGRDGQSHGMYRQARGGDHRVSLIQCQRNRACQERE